MDPSTHLLIAHEWTYGVTECLHILGFAVAIGSISLVDLHLLGWGFRGMTPAQALNETDVWTIGGLELAIAAGLVILSTDAARYLIHPTMKLKLLTLVVALVYNYTAHRMVVRRADHATPVTMITAAVSLLLWASIVFDGIFYAFS